MLVKCVNQLTGVLVQLRVGSCSTGAAVRQSQAHGTLLARPESLPVKMVVFHYSLLRLVNY